MAADVAKSPYIFAAQGDVIAKQMHVSCIRVVNGANAGTVLLKDKSSGRDVYRYTTMAANAVDDFFGVDKLDGLYVDTIPSGCYIYVYVK